MNSSSTDNQPTNSSAIHQLARIGLVQLATSTFLLQLLSWGLTILTVRFLSPSDYGLFALVETFVPYLALIATLDLASWIIQEKSFSTAQEEGAYTFALLLGGGVSLFALGLSPFIATFYQNKELTLPFAVISLSFLIRSFGLLPEAMLKRELRFKEIAVINFTVGTTRSILQLALAAFGLGYWALVLGFLFRDIVTCFWLVAVRNPPRQFRLDFALVKKAFSFGAPATFGALCWIIYSTSDNLVVGKLLGPAWLGYYAMAFYFIDLPMSKINTVIRPILIPYFSRLRELPGELPLAFLRTLSAFTLITFPVISGLGLVATELVPLVLGNDWRAMIVPLQVLSAIGLLRSLTNNTAPLFFAIGKPKLEMFCNILGALILPPSFYLAGTYYGLPGIFCTWALYLPLLWGLTLLLLERTVGISARAFCRQLVPAFTATVLMTILCLLLHLLISSLLSPFLLLLLKVIIGGLSYLGVCFFFYGKDFLPLIWSMGMEGGRSKA